MKKVFVDSSVLFTAVNSPTGGSAKLFTLKNIQLVTSSFVLTEVERNIRKKLQSYHLARFFMLVGKVKIVSQIPKKQANTGILVTLDKKHFFTDEVKLFLKPQKIVTPKMFLKYS